MTETISTRQTNNDTGVLNISALIRGAHLANDNGDRATTTSLLDMARDAIDALTDECLGK